MSSNFWIIYAFVLTGAVVGSAGSVTSAITGGGGRSSAGAYVNDSSICTMSGFSDSGICTNRSGYIGQLTETASLALTGTPARVSEAATTQLSGTAVMSDATLTALTGNEINWGGAVWPLTSIDSNGLATAALVYQDTSAALNGTYLGVNNSAALLVLDTSPDNYGSYAGDGLPDAWQVRYFGLDNPNATPTADPTGCGQNNQFKYIAGLDPTNAASLFRMLIECPQGEPNHVKIIFSPRWKDRTYTPIYCTNLTGSAGWMNLLTTTLSDNNAERTLTDTNAMDRTRFYRIRLTYP